MPSFFSTDIKDIHTNRAAHSLPPHHGKQSPVMMSRMNMSSLDVRLFPSYHSYTVAPLYLTLKMIISSLCEKTTTFLDKCIIIDATYK